MEKSALENNQNLCVYYKENNGLRFEKQEHIFPAFIGGIKMLDQGVVSDEANELFSGIEKHVSMESLVNINRMFYGPGKRGSKNPKKSGTPKIGVMCSPEGRTSLGYIVMGKPKQIPQCFLETDTDGNKLEMAIDAEEKDYAEQRAAQFIEELKIYDVKKAICIPDSRIEKNRKILGNHKEKWFLAYNSTLDEYMVKKEVDVFIKRLKDKKFIQESSGECKVVRENPKFEFQYKMDMGKFLRFCAKIAFNVSTYINGREFILNESFDEIRKAILSGENINKYARLLPENPLKLLNDLHYEKKYGEHLHSVVCLKTKDGYSAIVSLYGFITCVMVKLTDDVNVHPLKAQDGFFCDWENRKEYDMREFLEGFE